MFNNSALWIFAIVLGAALVAISNIGYNRARDFENKQTKAIQVRALLRDELQRNYKLIDRMQENVARRAVLIENFDTTAWQTVSASDLLLGLPNDELATLMRAYHLLHRANALHAQLVDTSVGVASALASSQGTRDVLLNELSSVLDQLKPLMKTITGG